MISQEAAASADATRRAARPVRPVAAVLADGTACYAPVGEVVMDGDLVTCHLCGRSFRSVAAHLASHGWTKARYCEVFGLERSQPLEGEQTRKLRAAAFSVRLLFDPAVRAGSKAGRARAGTGELAKDAAAAARGRAFPEQRRRKTAQARTASPSAVVAAANRKRADRHLADAAAAAARAHGYPDIGAFVTDRTRAGLSLAAISREAGLHKDWLSRHLPRVDPAAAAAARQLASNRADATLVAALPRLGYRNVTSYLHERHLVQHQTVSAIAAEVGLSPRLVTAALNRHGLTPVLHASKRHAAAKRAAEVADRLGYPSIADYVRSCQAEGMSWRAIAAESGQPQTWLRRHSTQ